MVVFTSTSFSQTDYCFTKKRMSEENPQNKIIFVQKKMDLMEMMEMDRNKLLRYIEIRPEPC